MDKQTGQMDKQTRQMVILFLIQYFIIWPTFQNFFIKNEVDYKNHTNMLVSADKDS